MPRSAEPDPHAWRELYGHRIEEPAGTPAAPQARPAPVRHRSAPGAPSPLIPLQRGVWSEATAGARGEDDAGPLSEEALLRHRYDAPGQGWRRWVHRWSGGLVDLGPSGQELAHRALLARIRRPLPGTHRVAVTSIKGGVGKTCVAACLGLVLAEHRGDRVVTLDANPDPGTLADRLTGEPTVTVRELLRDLDRIGTWTDMSRYTSLAGRLQVLASEQDPASGASFGREEYERISALLGRFFNIAVTDSGTGLVHSAMAGTLRLADSLLVVGSPTVDGAGRAAKTLDWLHAHGHAALAADALVVLSHDRVSLDVDERRIRAYFTSRCRAVVDIPHDRHLATGGRIELGRLHPRTRDAFLQLAALITDRFPVGSVVRAQAPSPAQPPPLSPPHGAPPAPPQGAYRPPARAARASGEPAAGGPTLEA